MATGVADRPLTGSDLRASDVGEIAPQKASRLSGVRAGWQVGLLSWLMAASRDTISQIAAASLVASSIVYANLHHAALGTVEILADALSGHTSGGVFVAILKYGQARPEAQSAAARGR